MASHPLSDVDAAFFHRHAPAALARRDGAYFTRQRMLWGDWIATGLVGLVGMHAFGWSAIAAALVLVASYWIGWLGDVVFWLARRDAIARASGVAGDDEYVWALLRVLRGERRDAAGTGGAGPPFGVSIVVDLVAGGAATVLMVSGFLSAGVDLGATLRSVPFVAGTALLLAIGALPLLVSRLTAHGDSVEPPLFRYGQRGIGLIVMVFALMAAGGGELSGRMMMSVVYGFLLGMGVLQWTVDLPRKQEAADVLHARLLRGGGA